jgi:Uma2 family endonuclease
MLAAKPRPATYADIEALPSHMTGQILYGVLHAHPRPSYKHGEAAGNAYAEVKAHFGRRRNAPGGWIFQVEPEVHLGPHVVVPDIGGWKTTTMDRLPDGHFTETPPDWLAEVLSPSTAQIDRTDKMRIYAEYKVAHCWLIDPALRTLEVFALAGSAFSLVATFKDDDAVVAVPFETHTFPLGNLWMDDV